MAFQGHHPDEAETLKLGGGKGKIFKNSNKKSNRNQLFMIISLSVKKAGFKFDQKERKKNLITQPNICYFKDWGKNIILIYRSLQRTAFISS